MQKIPNASLEVRAIFVGLSVACSLLANGCNRTEPTVAAQGTVRLDGKPLETGSIGFFPMSGTRGPAASAQVINGQFVIPAEANLRPGEFRVEVTAYRLQGKQQGINIDTGKQESVDGYVPMIPNRYNRDSELTASLSANALNELEYDLKTR